MSTLANFCSILITSAKNFLPLSFSNPSSFAPITFKFVNYPNTPLITSFTFITSVQPIFASLLITSFNNSTNSSWVLSVNLYFNIFITYSNIPISMLLPINLFRFSFYFSNCTNFSFSFPCYNLDSLIISFNSCTYYLSSSCLTLSLSSPDLPETPLTDLYLTDCTLNSSISASKQLICLFSSLFSISISLYPNNSSFNLIIYIDRAHCCLSYSSIFNFSLFYLISFLLWRCSL